MHLETKKTIAKWAFIGAGGVATLGLAGWGISSLFHGQATTPDKIAQTTPAAVTPRIVAPTVTPVPEAKPAPAAIAPTATASGVDPEKLAIARLEKNDIKAMQAQGYKVNKRVLPFGSACNQNGRTDGSGSHGLSTAIAYDVTKNGQSGVLCITHDGKKGHFASSGPL